MYKNPLSKIIQVETIEAFVKSEDELRAIYNIPTIQKDVSPPEREHIHQQQAEAEGNERQLHHISQSSIELVPPQHSVGGQTC